MKKLTFLVYHKEYEDFLKDIRELGVVHISEKQQGSVENPELQDNIKLSGRLASTLNLLNGINAAGKRKIDADALGSPEQGFKVLDQIEELQNEKNKLVHQLQLHSKDESSLSPWGNFDPQMLKKLHDAGIDVGFYICPENIYNTEWEKLYQATVINRASSKIYFITLTKRGEVVDLDVERVRLPHHSLVQVESSINEVQGAISANDEKMSALAAESVPAVKAAVQQLHREIEFSKVLLNTEHTAGEKLMLLEGWIPVSKEAEARKYLEKNNAWFEVSNPVPGDDIPILLKNKGLFSWFEPICKLYMLPRYGELDLTPFFAPFFMVFFGLCLGDMGYGLLLLLGISIYRLCAKTIKESLKPVLSLMQVLAFSTIVCGLLTGGFFGYNLYDLEWPFVVRLRELVALDNDQMFRLSLILGVIQIMFGMILKVVNQIIQFGFKYAVSTIGWTVLLLSVIAASLAPSVMPMGGTVHLVIMGIAALMIFLYNSPGKNVFLNIGLGLWDTYNMATGLLGDILSYVRLFALGLSGGILASVFNNLASGLSPDNIIAGPIVFVLIFVIGHAINIFMNVLGALVHPMRLTFVEFFKNAGYEGGGAEYRPFSK